MSEEIKVTADVGGRAITLDPILDTDPNIVIPVRRVESTIPCGFQQVFGEVTTTLDGVGEVNVTLTSGAGWGNRWMTLTVERDGETVANECLDVTDLVTAWLKRVERDGPTPKRTGE